MDCNPALATPLQQHLHIDDIADEVLDHILNAVRHTGIKHMPAALRVSRKWYSIGEKLVWRDVVLTGPELLSFTGKVMRAPLRSSLCQRIRSLTIHTITRIDSTAVNPWGNFDYDKSLRYIAAHFPNMTNLQSFSLNNEVDSMDPWRGGQIRSDVVLALVEYLPRSVKHLEINCPSMYFQQRSGEACLCEVVASRLEGLRSLRLVWPRLCAEILQPSSTLEYLTINTAKSDLRPTLRECTLADRQTSMSWDELQEQASTTSKLALRAAMAKLSPVFIKESFPQLRQWRIVEPYHFAQQSAYQWFLLNVHSVSHDRNDTTAPPELKTRSYPIWPNGSPGDTDHDVYQFVLRHCMHGSGETQQDLMEHDCSEGDIVAMPSVLWHLLEGEAGWQSTSNLSRHPRLTSTSPAARDVVRASRSKFQREEFYSAHRRMISSMCRPHIDLDKEDNRDRNQFFDFHGNCGVEAREIGTAYLWNLEKRLNQSILWGREFENGLQFELYEEDFTPVSEQLHQAQIDLQVNEPDD